MAKKKDLKKIAKNEWAPEQAKLEVEMPKDSADSSVTLVTDPYGIRTQEIHDSQNDDDAISEDLAAEDFSEALAESDSRLEKLEVAMKVEHNRNLEDLTQAAENQKEDLARELAEQIAEDEALKALEEQEAEEEMSEELKAALPSRSENGEIDAEELQSCIETLLFMSDKPVTLNKLKEWLVLEMESQGIRDALYNLQERYKSPAHGFELVEVGGGYQFRTKPIRAALAKRLAKVQSQRLSRGAMETLAIVAYKQPVLKEDIDQIRGVDSSHFIRTLLDKKLIYMAGRSELPGRPIVYETTQEFLEIFALKDLASLPPLKELEQMVPASQSDDPANEDPKVREMRRLVAEMKSDKHRLQYDPKEDEKLLGDIRERVKSIPTSTPYLQQLEAEENGDTAPAETGPAQMDLAEAKPQTEPSAEAPAETESPTENSPTEPVLAAPAETLDSTPSVEA
jgi:segregation and condensation protein B